MTPDRFKPLLDREFLKAELHYEYLEFCAGAVDAELASGDGFEMFNQIGIKAIIAAPW